MIGNLKLSPVVISLVVLSNVTAALAAPLTNSVSTKPARFRLLEFPADYSVGFVVVLNKVDDLEANLKGETYCAARGKVNVPADKVLKFEPNCHFFEHPESISKLPADAFSYLDMRFSAMDDKEENYVDRSIDHIIRLKGLRGICFDKSDITDGAAAKLSALPQLERISFADTAINGSCLHSLVACKKLSFVRLGSCRIDKSVSPCFSQLPQLRRLVVMRVGLTKADMDNIAKCSQLVNIDVSHNNGVDDSCMPALLKLTRLESINLKDTRISIKGLLQFNQRHLWDVHPPLDFECYSAADRLRLKKKFPLLKTAVQKSTTFDQNPEILFAPTTRGRR
jgi:hypothetical protein